jgi:chemotaxis protein MotB
MALPSGTAGRGLASMRQWVGRTGALQEPRSVTGLNMARQLHIQRAEGESWMMVYLDVLTLLLVTLVLASARLPPGSDSTRPAPPLHGHRPQATHTAPDQPPGREDGLLPGSDSLLQERSLVAILKATPGLEGLDVSVEGGRVNLTLPEGILFATGQADLIGNAHRVLDRIAGILRQSQAPISVEGHTDSRPISTGRFPSNWELSAIRATTVVRALAERGVAPGRMSAVGYGDTRPVSPNDTEEGRGRNRRVILVIHFKGG